MGTSISRSILVHNLPVTKSKSWTIIERGILFPFKPLTQGRTLKFYLGGGCQHALDRLNFSGPTERIWAVRTHWEL